MRPEIELIIPKSIELRCRAWCRRWFPREAYGMLLGTMLGGTAQVDELWLPSEADAEEYFKVDRVWFKDEWVHEIQEWAEEHELMLLGDFHSHPYLKTEMRMDPVQSATDIDFAGKHAVFGIINVEQQRSGRLTTCVRWWGPSVKVKVKRI